MVGFIRRRIIASASNRFEYYARPLLAEQKLTAWLGLFASACASGPCCFRWNPVAAAKFLRLASLKCFSYRCTFYWVSLAFHGVGFLCDPFQDEANNELDRDATGRQLSNSTETQHPRGLLLHGQNSPPGALIVGRPRVQHK